MSEVGWILDQLTRSFTGEAWHGPSLEEVLRGVDAPLASGRPLAGAHSIWEIVLHITSTQNLVLQRLRGNAVKLSAQEDWPPVTDASEEAWDSALDLLRTSFRQVAAEIERLGNAQLDDPILPGHSSRYVTLHGLVQHNLYHAGQISLLKNAATSR